MTLEKVTRSFVFFVQLLELKVVLEYIWPGQLKVPPPVTSYKLYTHTHTHTHTHARTCIVVAYTYLRVYFMITTTVAHRATLFLLVSKELNDIVFQLQRVAYSPDTTRRAQRVL